MQAYKKIIAQFLLTLFLGVVFHNAVPHVHHIHGELTDLLDHFGTHHHDHHHDGHLHASDENHHHSADVHCADQHTHTDLLGTLFDHHCHQGSECLEILVSTKEIWTKDQQQVLTFANTSPPEIPELTALISTNEFYYTPTHPVAELLHTRPLRGPPYLG